MSVASLNAGSINACRESYLEVFWWWKKKTEKIAILRRKLVSIDTTDQAEIVIADYLADLFTHNTVSDWKGNDF